MKSAACRDFQGRRSCSIWADCLQIAYKAKGEPPIEKALLPIR